MAAFQTRPRYFSPRDIDRGLEAGRTAPEVHHEQMEPKGFSPWDKPGRVTCPAFSFPKQLADSWHTLLPCTSFDDDAIVVVRKGGHMGMFDYVVVLDEHLCCAEGHPLSGFQTKSFDHPSMDTYLISGQCLYLVSRRGQAERDDESAAHWRLDGTHAVYQRRHAVNPITPPVDLVFYTTCDACAPVLVRSDHAHAWSDLVAERHLWVEFRATFAVDQPRHIKRTSGTRSDLIAELREESLRVLRDDEPLAIAHREIRSARDARTVRGRARPS